MRAARVNSLALLLVAASASAQGLPSGAAMGGAQAADRQGAAQGMAGAPALTPPDLAQETCRETWTRERQPPRLVETFPERGTAGHTVRLEVAITHPKGQQVFPGGINLSEDSPQAEALQNAQFRLPAPASEVQPSIERQEEQDGATVTTRVSLPIIALPDSAGRHTLRLPSLPIAIARASGRVQTLCTKSHEILVEDPLASVAEAEQRPDPPARPQKEIWTAARDAVLALLVALPIAAALLWALLWAKRRFKKAPKPPPPIPPWELAQRQLDEVTRSGLLEREQYEEHLDRVSDALRQYLGARYGFDGLESTTRETLRQLEQRAPGFRERDAVRTLLQRADLVKFARRLPDEVECKDALGEARRIIEATTPIKPLAPNQPGEAAADRSSTTDRQLPAESGTTESDPPKGRSQ